MSEELNNPKINPFLKIPFRSLETIELTEGWFYSDQEKAIHKRTLHGGIDFAGNRGVPVLAAASGYALSSYQRGYENINYKRKRVGMGYGNFVVIWHPENKLFTLYGHLDSVSTGIPFIEPVPKEENLETPVFKFSIEEFIKKSKKIMAPSIVGLLGDSGLSWGYKEEPGLRPDPAKFPSWDETHVHFEVYKLQNQTRQKYDPYNIYGTFNEYKINKQKENGFWLL